MAPRVLKSCFGRRPSDVDKKPTAADATAPAPEHRRKLGPVVVELFSSQGCATSPEAEVLFSRLGRGDFAAQLAAAPLILLSFHVDYWDYAGWKDPFAAAQWTVRQKAYVEALNLDTMFTPQIVVQGRAHCVADDPDAVLSAIAAAPRHPAPSLQAAFRRPGPKSLRVALKGSARPDPGYVILVALYECGLVTDCGGGANKGKVLANDYVVRRLEKLSPAPAGKKGISGTVEFGLWEGFNPAKCGMAVFVENSSRQIFGSQNFRLPDEILSESIVD
ncbi:uncharacterized protein LOC127253420 [Andrographis paniculata]|uniref:uncharacterized protein LOC127253420 n=1 Tax=Andrographis paniculata TaxID=175694 RepID=UPI0021E86BF2|nr:uncharacterized protein LOC127253420 [Andrographis paniculata]